MTYQHQRIIFKTFENQKNILHLFIWDKALYLCPSLLPFKAAPCHFWLPVCPYNFIMSAAAAAAKSLQSCPALCNPIDSSPPGSPVPGILQARTLEWGLPFPSPMHESEKWKWSHSVTSDPQRPHGLQPTKLLHPWDFPGKSTGVGCHCLLLMSTHISSASPFQWNTGHFIMNEYYVFKSEDMSKSMVTHYMMWAPCHSPPGMSLVLWRDELGRESAQAFPNGIPMPGCQESEHPLLPTPGLSSSLPRDDAVVCITWILVRGYCLICYLTRTSERKKVSMGLRVIFFPFRTTFFVSETNLRKLLSPVVLFWILISITWETLKCQCF